MGGSRAFLLGDSVVWEVCGISLWERRLSPCQLNLLVAEDLVCWHSLGLTAKRKRIDYAGVSLQDKRAIPPRVLTSPPSVIPLMANSRYRYGVESRPEKKFTKPNRPRARCLHRHDVNTVLPSSRGSRDRRTKKSSLVTANRVLARKRPMEQDA